MKRVFICLIGLALAGGMAACGGGGDNGGTTDDIVISPDAKTDTPKTDTPKVDTPKETSGTDGITIDNPPPEATDPGKTEEVTVQPDPGTTEDVTVQPEQGVETTDPGKEQGEGSYGSCAWFYECAQGCPPPPNNQACLAECQGELTSEGMANLQGLQTCLDTNGCLDKPTDQEFAQCLEDHCLDQYFKCFAGDTYLTCVDLATCLNGCPDGEAGQDCVNLCFSGASYEANWDWQHLIECLFGACPICEKQNKTEAETQQCIECQNEQLGTGGGCRDEYEKCSPSGTDNCTAVMNCLNTCGSDNACAQGCIGNGTFKAQELVFAIFDCFRETCKQYENDKQAWSQCATEAETGACKATIDACAADA